ncbi:MAG TPA: caspase family protein [Thermoanaerobaculia bacterium]|nr:caspase family protein [Thermoanaerobaculia bacterium]
MFVGVGEYPHDRMLTVPYAVDDAIDLAWRFALDQRVGLVPPRRVVLVISGTPQKEESKQRLADLKEAGARIMKEATTGDILHLLKEQAARAGDDGIFVLSIASHGFQHNGDAYILGSTSDFGSAETSLRAATIFDIAAQASRSLIFIDACRDRTGQGSRGGASADTSAPHITRMSHYRGQVIFYAAAPGQYAYDDDVHQNGVFTKAVLDGLNCEASAPRGTVIVDTLNSFVDRTVREWIRENKKRTVNAATQLSIEGQTGNMPLCECWRKPDSHIRVSVDGSIVTAYARDTTPLWRKNFGEPVIHAEVADLDADAFSETVVGLRSRIIVFDRDGKELWRRSGEPMTLATFTTGDLYEKHTNEIVALWNGSSTSRLAIFDSDGNERAKEYPALLRYIAIGRPTNMHAPKIAVATDTDLLLLHAKKLTPQWRKAIRVSSDAIRELQILDLNQDSRRELVASTARGPVGVTFEGKMLERGAPRPK